jgi:type IV pilus biogenesis protein PilP
MAGLRAAAFCASLGIFSSALAQDVAEQSLMDELTHLDHSILIMTRMKDAITLKTEIEKLRKEESGGPLEPQERQAPVVSSLSVFGKNSRAMLVYPDGSKIMARPGNRIPGGWRVASIGASGVTLEKNGVRVPLRMGSVAPEVPAAPPENQGNAAGFALQKTVTETQATTQPTLGGAQAAPMESVNQTKKPE